LVGALRRARGDIVFAVLQKILSGQGRRSMGGACFGLLGRRKKGVLWASYQEVATRQGSNRSPITRRKWNKQSLLQGKYLGESEATRRVFHPDRKEGHASYPGHGPEKERAICRPWMIGWERISGSGQGPVRAKRKAIKKYGETWKGKDALLLSDNARPGCGGPAASLSTNGGLRMQGNAASQHEGRE